MVRNGDYGDGSSSRSSYSTEHDPDYVSPSPPSQPRGNRLWQSNSPSRQTHGRDRDHHDGHRDGHHGGHSRDDPSSRDHLSAYGRGHRSSSLGFSSHQEVDDRGGYRRSIQEGDDRYRQPSDPHHHQRSSQDHQNRHGAQRVHGNGTHSRGNHRDGQHNSHRGIRGSGHDRRRSGHVEYEVDDNFSQDPNDGSYDGYTHAGQRPRAHLPSRPEDPRPVPGTWHRTPRDQNIRDELDEFNEIFSGRQRHDDRRHRNDRH